ncbi:MAG TPA: hypothetical protein PKC23_08680 [Candidatus Desulfobacillus sp.]|nr:hypothetical protein [Candidatus Desulfobacillus sp.]
MRHRNTATLLLGLAVFAAAALAHDDAWLDTQPTPNGGQQRMAGPYHLELVVAKTPPQAGEHPVVVYVTDHAGKEVTTAGARGSATLLAGDQKASAALLPDGGNRLRGAARYAPTPDLKVVVSVTLPGKPAEQARFTPLAARPAAGGGDGGHKH